MNFDDEIISLCLAGLLKNEKNGERERCLQKIQDVYGMNIKNLVAHKLS